MIKSFKLACYTSGQIFDLAFFEFVFILPSGPRIVSMSLSYQNTGLE